MFISPYGANCLKVMLSLSMLRISPKRSLWILMAIIVLSLGNPAARASSKPPATTEKPKPDVITFTNGDRLTGKLVKVLAGNVTFKSDIAGTVTVPWTKVKGLQTVRPYAVIEKDQKITKKTAHQKVLVGSLDVNDEKITVTAPSGQSATYAANKSNYVVEQTAFEHDIERQSGLLDGWTGTIALGATLVQATQSNQTYNAAISFVRTVPAVPWLPPASRTTVNMSGTYGLLTQPEIVSNGVVIEPASIAKTDILHGDAEYDRYVSKKAFLLAASSADHNYGSGLQLQQTYGLGVGWSLVKATNQTFDLKANLHYQQQQFYNGEVSNLGTPSLNLVGSDLTEIWTRSLKHGMKLNENITLTPTFNIVQAYSGVANAALIFPVYKSLNFNISSTDNYLGNPPAGYRRNTLQFTTGLAYVLK